MFELGLNFLQCCTAQGSVWEGSSPGHTLSEHFRNAWMWEGVYPARKARGVRLGSSFEASPILPARIEQVALTRQSPQQRRATEAGRG